MNCNSKQNTLKHLQQRGVLDKNGVILDKDAFQYLSEQYQELLKRKYNIEAPEALFSVTKLAVKKEQSNGDTLKVVYQAKPNNSLFAQIDTIINNQNHLDEPMDYFFEPSNTVFEPYYEKYIQYKQNLLSKLENRLKKVTNLKQKNTSNLQETRRLTSLEQELRLRIDGSEEQGIVGLEQEITTLSEAPPIERLGLYVQNDMDRLKGLVESTNPEDLSEARKIVGFYKEMGTLDIKREHPLFKMEDIFDQKGSVTLPANIVSNLAELRQQAENYENNLNRKSIDSTVNTVNTNSKIKDMFGDREFTSDQLFFKESGLKDTSWADMFLMDITNGIFSENGILPQVMMNVLKNSMEKHLVYAKSIEEKVNALQDEVERELRGMGYSINIPGINGVTYDLFRAMDENGQFKDSITQRYTSFFEEKRNGMSREFNALISKAKGMKEPIKKVQAFKEAFIFRDTWYKKNTITVDITRVPEIQNNPEFAEFSRYFNTGEAGTYKQTLINHFGENGNIGYNEEIAKQIKLIRGYKVALDVTRDNFIAKSGVEDFDSLSREDKRAFHIWEVRNNPFLGSNKINHGQAIKLGQLDYDSYMSYNYSIPLRNKVKATIENKAISYVPTAESTGYFDERYATIEGNSTLKEFHTVLTDLQEKMFESMPVEVREKFNAYSLPRLKKSIYEILSNRNLPLLQRISRAFREIIDNIKGLFGTNPQETLSYANVDPITGQPDYRVNSTFLKSNRQLIQSRYEIEINRFRLAMNMKPSSVLNQYDRLDLGHPSVNKNALQILAENFGTEPTLKAIKQRFPNEDLEIAEVGKMLKNAITHQVVSENSFDLPKIMKLFSYLTMEYAARQEALPLLEMMKHHYEEIKKPSITGIGEAITNAVSEETRLEGTRDNAIKQMNSWFERAALGNFGSKSEVGDTRLKNEAELKIGLTGNEKIDALTSKLQTSVDGKIRNREEKIIKGKLEKIIEDYKELRSNPVLEEEDLQIIEEKITGAEKALDKLGKQFSIVSTFDAIFNFIRFKGLGWNISSYITNYLEGQTANMIGAATGDYFTAENIYRANHVVAGSFLKNMTSVLGRKQIVTPGARKTRALMDRYRILQDASNELQKASSKSAFKKFAALSPYEGTRRVEYLNQAPLMISVLMDKKLTGIDGTESNVWDAMNPDGTLQDNFRTEEYINNWENADGQSYNDFSSHMAKTIVNLHGDYDELRGNMASEYVSGKALLMFKRWMARQFYQRFAMPGQSDLEVGIESYEGRYYSHTTSSASMHVGIIGFAAAGPFGAAIGAGVGAAYGKFYGSNSGLGFLRELAFTGKELVMNLMRLPINTITGKATIGHSDYSNMPGLNEREVNNLKANLIEMSIILAWIGLLLFAKGLFWEDEEDEDSNKRATHNLLANRFMQMSSQITMYLNPVSTYSNTVGNLPLIRFFTDVGKLAVETSDLLAGDDVIPTGVNAGESASYNQLKKTFFPSIAKDGLGFQKQTERQFQKSAFDKWFWGEEKVARKEVEKIRAKYKKKLRNQDISDTDVKKEVGKKFRSKKRDESYQDLLKYYQSIR